MTLDLSLYLVTDPALARQAGRTVPAIVAAAVAGGVTAVQVRDKNATTPELLDLLGRVAAVLPPHVALIVNDDVEAFLAARAAGISVSGMHVGQGDLPPERVRELVGPDAVIGLSAATPQELAAVDRAVVDYVGIGGLRGTSTKIDAPEALGTAGMIGRARLAPVPAVAIGGVSVEDARDLAGSGLAGVAVVSGIMAAADPKAAARAYARAFRSGAVPRVLSIAGTDPTGGAGIQADLKSIAANGGYGMAVVTSLVAQNTCGVRSVHTPPAEFLREQLDAVSDDVAIDAVKIGMLGDAATIDVVSEWLDRVRPDVVVLDPVMVATSGDRLLDAAAEEALEGLLPKADLITPNVPELAVISGQEPATDWDGVVTQALAAAGRWHVRVLAKGGHLQGATVSDALIDLEADEAVQVLAAPRIETTATHGTGCSLSSAVATLQASSGGAVDGGWFTSIDRAKQWLTESLRHGSALEVGRGHGPINHFAGLWSRGGITTSATVEWWERIADIRAGIESDPFVSSLVAGTLEEDAFNRYLAQDAEYLRAYAGVLERAAGLARDPDERRFWQGGAVQSLAEERRLHESWLGPQGQAAHAPATRAYVEHLRAAADAGYEQAVAAVLPCYVIYADLGDSFAAAATDSHPYRDWLATYDDPIFASAARQARAIVDRVAATADLATRERMWQTFRTSAAHERTFFAAPLARDFRPLGE